MLEFTGAQLTSASALAAIWPSSVCLVLFVHRSSLDHGRCCSTCSTGSNHQQSRRATIRHWQGHQYRQGKVFVSSIRHRCRFDRKSGCPGGLRTDADGRNSVVTNPHVAECLPNLQAPLVEKTKIRFKAIAWVRFNDLTGLQALRSSGISAASAATA